MMVVNILLWYMHDGCTYIIMVHAWWLYIYTDGTCMMDVHVYWWYNMSMTFRLVYCDYIMVMIAVWYLYDHGISGSSSISSCWYYAGTWWYQYSVADICTVNSATDI